MGVVFRLPDGWSEPQEVADVFDADGASVHRAGVSSVSPQGEEVCGSAAAPCGPASARARFELLERVSALEALREPKASYALLTEEGDRVGSCDAADAFPVSCEPNRWRYARSNGVALHATWEVACRRALWELAERDRVLRAWHGEITPRRLALDLGATPLSATSSYDWRAYAFPEERPGSFSRGVEVVGVFGFPREGELPFVLGLAGRPDVASSLGAAAAEALQLLAFLWGEPLPEVAGSAPSAAQHLDTYQVRGAHTVVRRWLEDGHGAYWTERRPARSPDRDVAFIDLTPAWLGGGLRVAKAVCKDATPLVFGDAPCARHLPEPLRLHPVP